MNPITRCLLTGYQLTTPATHENSTTAVYTNSVVGKVRISFPLVIQYQNANAYNHPILAGICRNAFEKHEEPPVITSDYVSNTLKSLVYPKAFKEKVRHLLKVIYDRGGVDYKPTSLYSHSDYPLCYSDGPEEFVRVMEYLQSKYWIEVGVTTPLVGGNAIYLDVLMTDSGIDEVEKGLPKVPMMSLVNQDITTGDTSIDERINHAKRLFFEQPQTMENMRSACEALAHVLEPLRNELTPTFSSSDVSDFFQIVNRFDIRHNKVDTLNLVHEEQYEWIFYTLLNSINTYTKLKRKFDS